MMMMIATLLFIIFFLFVPKNLLYGNIPLVDKGTNQVIKKKL